MASLVGAFSSVAAYWTWLTMSLQRGEHPASWADQYNFLKAYYLNNDLYTVLDNLFRTQGAVRQDLRPLRNPAYRLVEFYASKLWPGNLPDALPILTENESIIPAIEQVWTWSNWGSEKQAAARWFAMYGDMFLKVSTRTDEDSGAVTRVYLQNIEPQNMTDFDADERGYLTYARIDIPQQRRKTDGTTEAFMHTEVWTKLQYRMWEHEKLATEKIDNLGAPTLDFPTESFGIDFVPIVWQPFRNIGDKRGSGAFTPAIDKIDEANRQATRLHQMLFRYNKALWAASSNGNDAAGRPLPPPRIGDGSSNTLDIDDDTIIRLAGTQTLTALVPSINYDSALNVLNAQLAEIEKDLPELAYYSLREMTQVSGVAAVILLGDAIDKLLEARGNAETALVRANKMALTIGQNVGLFSDLGGVFEDGAFEHKFAPRGVLKLSDTEQAAMVQAWVTAGVPLATALRRAGWDEDEIAEMESDKEAEGMQNRTFAGAVLNQAQVDFDAGNPR